MEVAVKKKKFTREDYYLLADYGVIRPGERVELIDGEIIEMSPHNPPHVTCINRLTMLFASRLSGIAIVSVQLSMLVDENNVPEPDLVLYKHRDDFYKGELPQPKDALLVVEVANTSLEYDREVKSKLYANAGVKEYWIVDVVANKLERYTRPGHHQYDIKEVFDRHESVDLAELDFTVDLKKVFGQVDA